MKTFAIVTLAVSAALLALSAPLLADDAPDIEMLYQEALHLEKSQGDFDGAIAAYRKVIRQHEKSVPLAAKSRLHIAALLERQGKKDEAVAAYRELLRTFASSGEAQTADARLRALGAPVDRKPAAGESLAAKEEAVLDMKIAMAKVVLERRRTAFKGGAAAAEDVLQAELALAEAELEKQRFLQRKAAEIVTVVEAQVRNGGFGSSEFPGMEPSSRREVTLYRSDLPNFGGPQVLDIDTGRTQYVPSGTELAQFFQENPEFDIGFGRRPDIRLVLATDETQTWIPSVLGLKLNKNVKIAHVSHHATFWTLPDVIQYAEPTNLVAIEPDTRGIMLMRGGTSMEDLHIRRDSAGCIDIDLNKFVLRTDKGAEFLCSLIEIDNDFVRLHWKKVSRWQAPGPLRKVTLHDADIEGSELPQVLELESGETHSFLPSDTEGTFASMIRSNPYYDLVYDRNLIVMRKGARAALLPPGGNAADVQITPAMPPVPENHQLDRPGVYVLAAPEIGRVLVIENDEGPVLIETEDGAYLLSDIQRTKESVTFSYRKVC